jgi:hypothetical protein
MTRSRNPNQTKNKTAGGGESMAGRGMEVVFSEPMAVVVICGIKREKERPIGGEEREVKKKKKKIPPPLAKPQTVAEVLTRNLSLVAY